MKDDCRGGCPFQETLDLLGRRYALSILWALQQGSPRRFNELKRILGVNPVTLTQRLHDFAREGIVTRTEHPGRRPRVEYALTQKGHDLLPLIDGLETWSKKHNGHAVATTGPGRPAATA